jgi:hypothetical protein
MGHCIGASRIAGNRGRPLRAAPDLIPLGAGRAGVFVGDVIGRGLEAVAVMGQLRSAAA